MLLGRDPQDGDELASQPTLSCFENAIEGYRPEWCENMLQGGELSWDANLTSFYTLSDFFQYIAPFIQHDVS